MISPKRNSLRKNIAPVVKGSQKVGVPSPEETIEIDLLLRIDPKMEKLPTMEELSTLLPHKRKHLSHQEYQKNHSASQEDIEKVKTFAQKHRLDIVKVDRVQRLITLEGSIKNINKAFGVQIVHHLHPKFKTKFRTYEGSIEFPIDLKDILVTVIGLENIPVLRSFLSYQENNLSSSESNTGPGILYPNQLAQLYNFPKNLTGKGQTIAIIECGGGYDPNYLQQYFKKLNDQFGFEPNIENIIPVGVDGCSNQPCSDPDDLTNYTASMETYADIEVLASIAYEAKIVVYFTSDSYRGLIKALKQAIHDATHNISVISFSWGWPEPAKQSNPVHIMQNIVNDTLHEAAVRGITFCSASGDSGSCDNLVPEDDLAHTDFPASSPWSLACGGTFLDIQKDTIQNETTWKEYFSQYTIGNTTIKDVTFSTGGGVSEFFACPAYQIENGINPTSVNPPNSTGRGVPDVAGNADRHSGYIVQFGTEMANLGGTSMVAPLYAALVSLINQKLNSTVGFLNPFLYRIGKNQSQQDHQNLKKVFNDITEGDNCINNVPGYYAQKGWDPCTGWGSINGENLLESLQSLGNH